MKLSQLLEAKDKTPKPKREKSTVAKAFKRAGSQEELADKLDVDPSTISRWKSKKDGVERTPTINHLKALKKATGAATGDLVPGL